jgi:hypothetical protein
MTDTTMPGEPVAIQIPNELDRVFGYTGDARFVGFRYTCLGDQVVYEDGRSSGTGATWSYLAFKRHRAVASHLADYDLGSSEEDAAHMLLLDREHQTATVALVSEARAFLDAQWPEQAPMTPEQEELFRQELARLMEEIRNRPFDPEAMEHQQREQQTRMAVMLAFLDQQVPPSQGEGQTP